MTTKEYRYHIYNGERCVYHNLEEAQFRIIWEMMNSIVGPNTRPSSDDLSYEKVEYIKDTILESSH